MSSSYNNKIMASTTNLPDGWLMRQSRRYQGRVYYYNVDTGESTWEFPQQKCGHQRAATGPSLAKDVLSPQFPLLEALSPAGEKGACPLHFPPNTSVYSPPIREGSMFNTNVQLVHSDLHLNVHSSHYRESHFSSKHVQSTDSELQSNVYSPRYRERDLSNNLEQSTHSDLQPNVRSPQCKEKTFTKTSVRSSFSDELHGEITPQRQCVHSLNGHISNRESHINAQKETRNVVHSKRNKLSSVIIDDDKNNNNGKTKFAAKCNKKSSKTSILGRISKLLETGAASTILKQESQKRDAASKTINLRTGNGNCLKPYAKPLPKISKKANVSPVKSPGDGQTQNLASDTVKKNLALTSLKSSSRENTGGSIKLSVLVKQIEKSKSQALKMEQKGKISGQDLRASISKKRKNSELDVIDLTDDQRTVIKVSQAVKPPDRIVEVRGENLRSKTIQPKQKKQKTCVNKVKDAFSMHKEEMDKNLRVNAQVTLEPDVKESYRSHSQNLFGWDSIHVVQSGDADKKSVPVFAHLSTSMEKLTQRGWPGQLKPSDITSREIILMDIDEAAMDLPEGEEDDAHKEEDMEVVMTEVRQEVMAKLGQGQLGSADLISDEELHPDSSDQTLVIIIDTNILMSNISFLADLKDRDIEGFGRPYLVIPWIVLRELDVLKEGVRHGKPSLTKATQTKARAGINFLKTLLVKRHPRILTQTPRQAEEASKEFESVSNDETILQACLYTQKIYPQSRTVLLTNDNNLFLKSHASGVNAFNVTDFAVEFKTVTSKDKNSCFSRRSSIGNQTSLALSQAQTPINHPVSPECGNQLNASQIDCPEVKPGTGNMMVTEMSSIPSPAPSEDGCLANRLLNEEHSDSLESLVEDMYCKLRTVITESFGKVLEAEMKEAFDDLWKTVVLRKPPWTLRDVLDCWKKHWIAVFGIVFNRNLSYNVENLRQAFFYHRGVTLELVKDISENSLEILQECVRKRSAKYDQSVHQNKECVTQIFELANRLFLQLDKAETFPSLEEYLKSTSKKSSSKQRPRSSPILQEDTSAVKKTESINRPPLKTSGSDTVICNANENVCQSDALKAGEVLQNIWHLILKYCTYICDSVSGELTPCVRKEAQLMLELLVPTAKDIRIPFVGLLELPLEELSQHEETFIQLAHQCNHFFTKLDVKDCPHMETVLPLHLLILYTHPKHRETLQEFGAKLDEMLCHLYRCIEILMEGS